MTKLSVQVSESQKDFLAAQAAQQGLKSASDYVQQLIRAAEQRNGWAALETQMQTGLDSGEPFAITDSYSQEKKAKLLSKHSEAGL